MQSILFSCKFYIGPAQRAPPRAGVSCLIRLLQVEHDHLPSQHYQGEQKLIVETAPASAIANHEGEAGVSIGSDPIRKAA